MAISDIWERGIQELVAVRRKAIDSERGELPSPRPPAREDELAAAEKHLGISFDLGYRDFMQHANGWDGICGDILFGTHEFLGGNDLLRIATECFDAYVEFRDEWVEPTPLDGVSSGDLLAIGINNWTGAMTFIGKEGRPCAGQVFHIYNTAITLNDDFIVFFQRYVDFQREVSEL
ncbi:MAG: SMI1/KNR4 family protein [Thermoguttaceae bacterium]|jgi:hypothetical protein